MVMHWIHGRIGHWWHCWKFSLDWFQRSKSKLYTQAVGESQEGELLLFTYLCTMSWLEEAAFQEGEPFSGTILAKDELDFLMTISTLEFSPAPELRKIMKWKDIPPEKANTPFGSTLFWGWDFSHPRSLQQLVGKQGQGASEFGLLDWGGH